MFSQLIHIIDDVHSNDRYQNIKPRLTGYHFPHRQLHCGIIYQKTYSEHRSKYFLSRNDTNPLPFFYNGSQKAQIHCKLGLGMSDLNYDLLNRHLTTNSSCGCGEKRKDQKRPKNNNNKTHTLEHYILHCPRFTHVSQNTYSVSLQICLIFLPSYKGTQTYQTM